MIAPCRMIARASGASCSKARCVRDRCSMPDNSPASCGGPFSTRMFRDSEIKYFLPLMLQHQKHKQNPQVDSGHGEEIDSHDFPDVILEERFPGL